MVKSRLSEFGGSSNVVRLRGRSSHEDTHFPLLAFSRCRNRAAQLQTKTTQVLLPEEMLFTAILLRSAPHTLLTIAKHVLGG